jgi:glycerol uptake facilitator-like aquaporin
LFLLLPTVSLVLVGLSAVAYVVLLDAFGAAIAGVVVLLGMGLLVASSIYHRARDPRGGRSP